MTNVGLVCSGGDAEKGNGDNDGWGGDLTVRGDLGNDDGVMTAMMGIMQMTGMGRIVVLMVVTMATVVMGKTTVLVVLMRN